MSIPQEVRDLAAECADYRVVPFLGAGCSFEHLGIDWDSLCRRMSSRVGSTTTDNLKAASEFIERFGRAEFAELLREYLHVSSLVPEKASIHLSVMSLELGTLYTTNQDNLIELCHLTHGRPITTVVDIDDIASLKPGDSVLYKFHGDLGKPASIVYCTEDFAGRGPYSSHPLDIRLKSDALGKTLLFLGYSFRDPNIRATFSHLKDLFGSSIRRSKLVQYGADPDLTRMLNDEFGIESLESRTLYPAAATDAEALALFFRDLVDVTIDLRCDREMDAMFRGEAPWPTRVIVGTEVRAVGASIAANSVDEGLRVFRERYDGAQIPEAFQDEVVAQFESLCARATSQEQIRTLSGAIHNLNLSVGHALQVMVAGMCTMNMMGEFGMFDVLPDFRPTNVVPEATLIAFTLTLQLLRERDAVLSKGFYDWVARNDDRWLASYDDIPMEFKTQLELLFNDFYRSGKTTYENPLQRYRKLKDDPLFAQFLPRSAESLASDFMNLVPKRYAPPFRKS